MSKLKVFTVYDSAVGAYMQPFFMQSAGQAIRAMSDTLQSTEHQFSKHPADFTLFEIGTYDEETGKLFSLPAYINLGTCLELQARISPPSPAAPLSVAGQAPTNSAQLDLIDRVTKSVERNSERNMQ